MIHRGRGDEIRATRRGKGSNQFSRSSIVEDRSLRAHPAREIERDVNSAGFGDVRTPRAANRRGRDADRNARTTDLLDADAVFQHVANEVAIKGRYHAVSWLEGYYYATGTRNHHTVAALFEVLK